MPNPANLCPRCQSPIPADAPGGICPGCALLAAANPSEPTGPLSSAPTLEEVAAAFPELDVLDMIGHGGMGVVFKARQPRLDRCVALKILPPHLAAQPGFSERFTREARALARLNHPNIVAVYDFGESGGYFYLVMEYVEGVNLRQAIRAGVTPEQALALVPKLCEALQFAHDKGVLHRDIKPENILLDISGAVKLVDFGIAKMAGDNASAPGLTASGSMLGTAAYMAPEQIEKPGTVDHRADIYSLGVVFYEMLTGELPIGRFAAPSERSKVTRGVDEVVFRALEKERDRRQQSATEMRTQVEHLQAPAARARPPGAAVNPWPHRLRWLIIAIVVLPLTAGFSALVAPPIAKVAGDLGAFGALMVIFAQLLPIIAAIQLWFAYRRSLQKSWPAGPAAPWNPWPKRLFILIAAVLVVPALLIITGLMVPALQANRARKAPRLPPLLPGSYQSSPAVAVVRPERAPFIGRFPKGTVELIAVTRHPSGDAPWWAMDGGRAPEGPFKTGGGSSFAGAGQRAYEFIFRTRDLPAGASSPTWLFEHAVSWAGGGAPAQLENPTQPLSGYHFIAATLPRSVDRTNLKVGIAVGAWATLSQHPAGNAVGSSHTHEGVSWTIAQSAGLENKAGDTVVTFSHSRHADWQTRVVAFTKTGEEITASGGGRINEQTEASFPGRALASIAEFRFQVRRIDWVEFRRISLRPDEPRSSGAGDPPADRRAVGPTAGEPPARLPAAEPAAPLPQASAALQDEAIRLARERFEMVQTRLKTGLASQIEEAAAVRDLAIAEARGDGGKIARARVHFAEKQLELARGRFEHGLESQAQINFFESELNAARQELDRARPSVP